jgi:hypothetical protein
VLEQVADCVDLVGSDGAVEGCGTIFVHAVDRVRLVAPVRPVKPVLSSCNNSSSSRSCGRGRSKRPRPWSMRGLDHQSRGGISEVGCRHERRRKRERRREIVLQPAGWEDRKGSRKPTASILPKLSPKGIKSRERIPMRSLPSP